MISQSLLLNPNALQSLGPRIEAEWNSGIDILNNRPLPWRHLKEDLQSISEIMHFGYDIPLLFRPSDITPKVHVAIVAQDPLRHLETPGVSLSTPFGFHNLHMRQKGHYKKLWSWIECMVNDHHAEVLLTDVCKLYPVLQNRKRLAKLYDACIATLQVELNTIKPSKVFAMGAVARDTLTAIGVEHIHVPHIAHRLTTQERINIGHTMLQAL